MKLRYLFISIFFFLFFSCDLFQQEHSFSVSFHAVWNEDYSKTLIFESEWKSPNKNSIYYYDPKSYGWRNKAYLADANLKNPVLIAEWADEHGDSALGWFQTAMVFWNEAEKSIFYTDGDHGLIRNLVSGKRKEIAIPPHLIREYFTVGGQAFHENGKVSVMETLPSPNGKYVTVLHSAAIQVSTFEIVDLHALGVFKVDGSFIGSIPLDEWNLKEGVFLTNSPSYKDVAIAQGWQTMPTYNDFFVFWKEDSSGFFIVNKYADENGFEPALEVEIEELAGTLTRRYLDAKPDIGYPTSGGSVQKNKILVYKEKAGQRFEIKVAQF